MVSISLSDALLGEMDKLREGGRFSGRSEIIRAGLRSFLEEEKQRQDMRGKRSAILMAVHDERFDGQVVGIKREHEDLITTHLHSRIGGGRCVEMFLLDGDGRRIETVTRGFVASKNMDNVRLVVL